MLRLFLGMLLILPLGGKVVAEENRALKIVTYNIHHGEGTDGAIDLERIAAILLALDPDIVCLQEVDRNLERSHRLDFPAEFERLLHMKGVFESNFDFGGGEYGNATFTRLPIRSHVRHALPGPKGAEPRGALEVVVDWKDKPLRVLNTHLGLQVGERQEQTAAIAELLGAPLTIVCGDFNETPDGPAMQMLERSLRHCKEKTDEHDLTFSAQRPVVKIDHILVSKDLKCSDSAVIRTEATAVASDHLPLSATLTRIE